MSSAAHLCGKHAIVTGGGHGLGAAIARELARLGAQLTIMGRNRDALESHARDLRADTGREVTALDCDVTDEAAVARAFEKAQALSGPAYVLVNNAGYAEGAAFIETRRETWERVLAINLTGTYLCTREVIPGMIRSGDGRVVNIASTAGLKGYSHVSAYCAAKHGVVGLTRSLAVEVAKLGITVNAVCPSYVEGARTDQTVETLSQQLGKTTEEVRELIVRKIPRGKLIRPEEVADAVGWLCSPAASAITGQAIVVAGGEVL